VGVGVRFKGVSRHSLRDAAESHSDLGAENTAVMRYSATSETMPSDQLKPDTLQPSSGPSRPSKTGGMIGGLLTWHMQPYRPSKANCNVTCSQAGTLIDLLNPEDGGDMFLRNVDLQGTTRHYMPED
jgi:hypothetical protein